MSPGGRLRWRRVLGPARVYESDSARYEIIWDPVGEREGEPGGWYVWEGGLLLGVQPILKAAKEVAENRNAHA